MDTTPPQIVGGSGIFTVQLLGDYLVTTWPGAAVSDSEELFTLDYQFAIGKSSFSLNIFDREICSLCYCPCPFLWLFSF